MSENKTGKYLKYAIGEILLVMIGILLALQVNNWNEQKKDHKTELSYLQGIKDDLRSDIRAMDSIIIMFEKRKEKFLLLDSLTRYDLMDKSYLKEFDPPLILVVPLRAFRYKSGSYNSLISEGKSGLIRNRALLDEIQDVYNIDYDRLHDFSDRLDQYADRILWELRKDRYNTLESWYLNESHVLDILSAAGARNSYGSLLKETRENVLKVIKKIELEIK